MSVTELLGARAVKRIENHAEDKPVEFAESGLRKDFLEAVEERQSLKYQQALAEAKVKELDDRIASYLSAIKTNKVLMPDGSKVTLQPGTSSHISKERLLEQGVSIGQIERATTTRAYVSVRVYEKKD